MSGGQLIGVIGAGMAGASVAYELSLGSKVTILEQEAQPGFHSTGRSAAVFCENYGNPTVRSITALSREFLSRPPFDDVERPLLTARGAIFIATDMQQHQIQMMQTERTYGPAAPALLLQKELASLVPVLKSKWRLGLLERHAMDINVSLLHQAYLRHARKRGATVICNAQVTSITRKKNGWLVHYPGGELRFDLLVNAAGAWADTIARFAEVGALSLIPKRRTAFLFAPRLQSDFRQWPVVIDVNEQFYFKPEGQFLLGSLADETPNDAEDVQPDDLDVATAIDRIEQATTMQIERVTSTWAGLRTFSCDKSPVVGFDPREPRFFWLAGQGGYGIQMAPALAKASASLIRTGSLPQNFAHAALDAADIGPGRLIT